MSEWTEPLGLEAFGMTTDRHAYRSEIAQGVVRLLIEAGRLPGEQVAVVNATDASDELLMAIAFLIHSSPDCASPSATRRTCDLMARKLQARVAEVKRVAAAGGLPFVETLGVKH